MALGLREIQRERNKHCNKVTVMEDTGGWATKCPAKWKITMNLSQTSPVKAKTFYEFDI